MENINQKYKIVADSSADILKLENVEFSSAPLKIITDEKEFTDNELLDVEEMVTYLKSYKGRSSSSCPNPDEWLKAFGDAEYIFGVTISSGLSGSFTAAKVAKDIYESEHPGRRVFLIDSLSAGPEETLLVEKLEELISSGLEFDEICEKMTQYQKTTKIRFMLQSLTNFANNGRVNGAVARIAGILGICMVGTASAEGTLELTNKCRGVDKSIAEIVGYLKRDGLKKGKVRIAHCFNSDGAQKLKTAIMNEFSDIDIKVHNTRGLCSFYAEIGGLLIGYEMV